MERGGGNFVSHGPLFHSELRVPEPVPTYRSATPTGLSKHSDKVRASRRALPWVGGAVAGLVLGEIVLAAAGLGPIARHMGSHMVLMNVAAPLLAFAVVASGSGPSRVTSGYALTAATVLQLVLLWGWHAPVALGAALETTAGHAVMQTTLLVSALWFWFAVFADRAALHWRALLALLVTGKLFCLLGVLLIFAPRLLYRELAHSGHMAGSPLADQHLGGLLMVVVCPLTYVLAGIVISALGLKQIASEQDARLASQSSRKTLQAV